MTATTIRLGLRLRCAACGRFVAQAALRVVEIVWRSRGSGDGGRTRGIYHPFHRDPTLPCGPVRADVCAGPALRSLIGRLDLTEDELRRDLGLHDRRHYRPAYVNAPGPEPGMDQMRWDPQEAEDEIAEWRSLLRESRTMKRRA